MEENNKKKKMTDLPFQIEGSLKKLFIGADEIKNKNYDSIEFLVDKLIPMGTLCALVGESDTGKSSLLRQLALSLVYGDSDFLGFKLKDKPTTERLENSGPFGTMCTHRVRLTTEYEIDEELKGWINEAYEKSIQKNWLQQSL